ncbi:MAG: efflux RND transporter periplasmic adaptor subunit [Desulfobacteraceae bacterium]|nr:efflux RND transporter periplasmic adaptor subunit [Desulfobacteraceae bacterium]
MKRYTLIKQAMAAVATASLLFSCTGAPEEKEAELIRPVRYARVKTAAPESQRTFSGKLRSGTELKLSFRISGILAQIPVKVGDRLKKGNLVAALDDRDAKLKLQELKAAVMAARVKQESSASNLKRVSELYENNNLPLQDYETARSQYAGAKADLNAKSRQLDLQKRQLAYTVLTAPVDGVVSAVHMENDENVSVGTIVAEISSGGKLKISVDVPETYITRIQAGDRVEAKFAVKGDQTFHGTVSEISYVGSAASVYPVIVILDKEYQGIRPGMPADVTFSFEKKEERLVVPASSVGQDPDGHYLFVVKPLEEQGFARVMKTPVTIGNLTDQGFEILEGVAAGDLVVTSGVTRITHEQKVRFNRP